MIENVIAHLFNCFDRKDARREIEDELRFHLEELTQEHLRQGMTLEEAEHEALKRFGNVERIKNQCVEISRRSHPLVRAMKSFLIVVFLAGVLARIFSVDMYVTQVGNMLIVIAALSHLLLYVRGLSNSSLDSKPENLSLLRLSNDVRMPIAVKDQRELTPVERVISDE